MSAPDANGWMRILLPVVVACVIYGLGAFVAWDLNPGHWNPIGRGLAAFAALVLGVAAACAPDA